MSSSSKGDASSTTAAAPSGVGGGGGGSQQADLLVAVDELLDEMRGKFSAISKEMLTKMDEMTKRLDSLEASMKAQERQSPPGRQ